MSKAIILAGGLGIRLKPFTDVIPKPLLPIGEKAVLEIQIEHLVRHGFKEIFLATNYKSTYVENFFGDGSRYGVKLQISKEEKPLGTAGPVKLLQDQIDAPFLVMNGDVLSSADFSKMFSFAIEKKAVLTVGIKRIVTPYAFGNIFYENDYVTGIQEKPDFVTYALAGIYVMQPGIFEFIPDDEYFGMDALIQKMLALKVPVLKYEITEYWLDIGRLDDYEKAQDIYGNGKHFRDED